MKKLGIIAGMGPFASTAFIKRILELTPAPKEWDHIRMLVDYNIEIPSRTRCLLYGEPSPLPGIIETINGLADYGADLVVIPCNSAHHWYNDAKSQIKIPWLNMIEVTSNEVSRHNLKSVLIMGAYTTVTKKLYDEFLSNTIYLNESEMNELYRIIERLKLNGCKKNIKEDFKKLVKAYQGKVEGLILACTEPSMLFGNDELDWEGFKIFDSTSLYAKKCVEIFKDVYK